MKHMTNLKQYFPYYHLYMYVHVQCTHTYVMYIQKL